MHNNRVFRDKSFWPNSANKIKLFFSKTFSKEQMPQQKQAECKHFPDLAEILRHQGVINRSGGIMRVIR